MTKPKLLIVDDDEDIRTQMKWALAQHYDVHMAGDRAGALAAFSSDPPSTILLDLGLPPRPNDPDEGLATLADLLSADRRAKIIVVSGQGDKENALRAVGAGAYDFLCKPVDMDELRVVLQRCVYVAQLERDYQALQRVEQGDAFEGMLGTSQPMRAVFNFVSKVGPSNAPVLILGESGTGKEMVAQALHRRSPQQSGPFVAINCSAIPENLLESELFGHEKGSFTGAHVQRKGLVETAAGGTLFLDEIGELPPSVQVKLLRFLQEKRFQRVGGRAEIQSDTRVVAATNVNLQESVANGTFREDLYFRLAVVVAKVPALRDRSDDIDMLAKAFLHRYATLHSKRGVTFTADALRAVRLHRWPGNVRELQNRVQRAVIMADGKRVTAGDLELTETLEEGTTPPTLREARENVERDLVRDALRRHRGKITAAALELGISRPTLYELMEKLGLERSFESLK
jgi:two-component system, NtrC family, response regulator